MNIQELQKSYGNKHDISYFSLWEFQLISEVAVK